MKSFSLLIKRALLVLLATAVPLAFVGCGGSSGGSTPQVILTALGLAPASAELTVGGTQDVEVVSATVQVGEDEPQEIEELTEEALDQAVEDGELTEAQRQLILDAVAAIEWSTEDSAVASVDGEELAATITAEGEGETNIIASVSGEVANPDQFAAAEENEEEEDDGTVSAMIAVTVTAAMADELEASPDPITVDVGETQAITVTRGDEDVTADASFESDDDTVASVSADGVVTGEAPGTAVITVTEGDDTVEVDVTVNDVGPGELTVDPESVELIVSRTAQIEASLGDEPTDADWESDDETVATVDADGVITAVGEGTATITATVDDQTADVDVTVRALEAGDIDTLAVSADSLTIDVGDDATFTALADLGDGGEDIDVTDLVTWSVADDTVATLDGNVATGVAAGSTAVTADFDGVEGSATLTVNAVEPVLESLTVTLAPESIGVGETSTITVEATYDDGTSDDVTDDATITSSDTDVATVDGDEATALAEGTADITASLDGVDSDPATLTVTAPVIAAISIMPTDGSVPVGTTLAMTATADFSDGMTDIDVTSDVMWSVDDESIATIDTDGVLTGVSAGTVTVTATSPDGSVTASVMVDVTAVQIVSIAVTSMGGDSGTTEVDDGNTVQLVATATFSDSTTSDVTATATWASATETVATVDAAGLVTAVDPGTSMVSATVMVDGAPVSGSITVVVGDAVPTELVILGVPVNPPAAGATLNLTAQVTFSDGTTQNVTSSAVWGITDDPDGALQDDGNGVFTTLAAGTATVEATYTDGGVTVTGTAAITVSDAVPVTLEISPGTATQAPGLTVQYTATVTLSDGTSDDVTDAVTWGASTADVTVDAAGLATVAAAAVPGTMVTIDASYTAAGTTVTAQATLNVSNATPQSLVIQPATSTIFTGFTTAYTATLTLSDDSVQDVTNSVAWTTGDATIATITNLGIATGVAAGTTSISATLNPVGGTPFPADAPASITVENANLTSLVITPNSVIVPRGQTRQFTATGTFDNGQVRDVTRDVAWSVIQPNCGSMVNTRGTLPNPALECLTIQGGNYITISNDNASVGLATANQATADIFLGNGDDPPGGGNLWFGTIRATFQDVTAIASMAVSTDAITEIEVLNLDDASAAAFDLNPGDSGVYTNILDMGVGVTTNLRAFCTFEDTTQGDCTDLITFTVTDTNSVLLDNANNTLTGNAFGGTVLSAQLPPSAVPGATVNMLQIAVDNCDYQDIEIFILDAQGNDITGDDIPLGRTAQAVAELSGSTAGCDPVFVSSGTNITWSSDAPGALSVSPNGVLVASTTPLPPLTGGELDVDLTARYQKDGQDLSDLLTVTLVDACVDSFTVVPAVDTTVPTITSNNFGQQLDVFSHFSDPNLAPGIATGDLDLVYPTNNPAGHGAITADGYWTPSNTPGVYQITVTAAPGTTVGGGMVCPSGAEGTVEVTLVNSALQSLDIVASTSTIGLGEDNIDLVAIAMFDNPAINPWDVTEQVTWSSNNGTGSPIPVLDVDNVTNPPLQQKGRLHPATGQVEGNAVIVVNWLSVSATEQITVSGAPIEDIRVGVAPGFNDMGICGDFLAGDATEPAHGSPTSIFYTTFDSDVPTNVEYPLVAIALRSDGTSQDITTLVTFNVSGTGAAVVNDAILLTQADGTVTITATIDEGGGPVTSTPGRSLNLTVDDAFSVFAVNITPPAQNVGLQEDSLPQGIQREYNLISTFRRTIGTTDELLDCEVSTFATWTLTQPAGGTSTLSDQGLLTVGTTAQIGTNLDVDASYLGNTVRRNVVISGACAQFITMTPATGLLLDGDPDSTATSMVQVGMSDGSVLSQLDPLTIRWETNNDGTDLRFDDSMFATQYFDGAVLDDVSNNGNVGSADTCYEDNDDSGALATGLDGSSVCVVTQGQSVEVFSGGSLGTLPATQNLRGVMYSEEGNNPATCDGLPLVVQNPDRTTLTIEEDIENVTIDCDDSAVFGQASILGGQIPAGVGGLCKVFGEPSSTGTPTDITAIIDPADFVVTPGSVGMPTINGRVTIEGFGDWFSFTAPLPNQTQGVFSFDASIANETATSAQIQSFQPTTLDVVIRDDDADFSTNPADNVGNPTLPVVAGVNFESQFYGFAIFGGFTGSNSRAYNITELGTWAPAAPTPTLSVVDGLVTMLGDLTAQPVSVTLPGYADTAVYNPTGTMTVIPQADQCQNGTIEIFLVNNPGAGDISGDTILLGRGRTEPFTAECFLQNAGEVVDITTAALWQSNTTGVAVANDGIITVPGTAPFNIPATITVSVDAVTETFFVEAIDPCFEELMLTEVIQGQPNGSDLPNNVPIEVQLFGRRSNSTDFVLVDTASTQVVGGVNDEFPVISRSTGTGPADELSIDTDELCLNLATPNGSQVGTMAWAWQGITATPASVRIFAANAATPLPLGDERQYQGLASFPGFPGTEFDVTRSSQSDWDTSDPGITEMIELGLISADGLGTEFITLDFMNVSDDQSITVTNAVPESVTLYVFQPRNPAFGTTGPNPDCDDSLFANFTSADSAAGAAFPMGGFTSRVELEITLTDGSTQLADPANYTVDVLTPAAGLQAVPSADGFLLISGPSAETGIEIQATHNLGFQDSILVDTLNTTIQDLTAVPATQTIMALGQMRDIFLVGSFNNSDDFCMTRDATSFTTMATELSVSGNTVTGLATTNGAGREVVASYEPSLLTSELNFIVTNAQIEDVDLRPDAGITLNEGETGQGRAFADFTDGTEDVEVTSDFTRGRWCVAGSAPPTCAQTSNGISIDDDGVVTAGLGSAGETATFQFYNPNGSIYPLDVGTPGTPDTLVITVNP